MKSPSWLLVVGTLLTIAAGCSQERKKESDGGNSSRIGQEQQWTETFSQNAS
jgi:hypothetical protein